MFRIILTLGFTLLFAYAQTCNFSNSSQDECEIDIENPPLMEHKFINDDGSAFSEFQACVASENIEIDETPYSVLDCSMVENKKGNLTEGVTISNNKNLIKNRVVTIKQDNVLIRVAGDFVIDSGIRFNTKNTKNFIIEVVEGTNTKSNLILQRGAALKAKTIFMPEGANSSIFVNTFYGGIYEKEFIDIINKNSARGDMETLLNVDNIFAISSDGGDDTGGIIEFDGNIACGPEVNPLDLENKEYVLKRLFRVKNTSIDAPSDDNAICNVKEGACFEGLLEFGNRKFDGKSYKVATTKAKIIPTYDIFIESGKIISSDNKTLKNIAPSAKIKEQNYGACEKPAKVAFDKSVVEEYLASLEEEGASEVADSAKYEEIEEEIEIAQNAESSAESGVQKEPTQEQAIDSADSAKSAESTPAQDTQEYAQDAESSEYNAELEENLQDLLETFKSKKLAGKSAESSETSATSPTKNAESSAESKSAESSADEPTLNVVKDAPKKEMLEINDEFLIVEGKAYDKFNKSCYGDLQCIYNELLPLDKIVWTKKSSKNTTNKIFVLNVSDDNLSLKCEVRDLYGKNLKKSFDLSATNTIGIIDLKFPTSSASTQITCKGAKQEKTTNKIIVTPASFDINYSFANAGVKTIPTLKAGKLKVNFKGGRALTMEGALDDGFSQNLAISDISFVKKDYCTNGEVEKIPAPKDVALSFKKGYLKNASMDIMAKTIALGDLKIDFAIPNNDSTCAPNDALKPACTTANITKEVSIIPANFRIDAKIESASKVSYYGQLEDKFTFKYNPLLNLEIRALDNTGKAISVNKSCGSIELELKSNKLIEFKRTSSDRLNSKITAYLSDFENESSTNIKAYFGINKLIDEYQNSRTMNQSDLLEPVEITTQDLAFNLRFKNGKSQFVYDNPDIYDNVINEVLVSVLIARGKLQVNDIKGDTRNPATLIAKYAIYCKTCDRAMLAKYLQGEPEVESQYWYINNQHISDFYIRDRFISARAIKDDAQKEYGKIEIKNSQTALEGRQKITFGSNTSGTYSIYFAQRAGEFAPYLNYSEGYKNSHKINSLKVMIAQNKQDILDKIKAEEEAKIAESSEEKSAESKKTEPKKPSATPAKPAQKPVSKPTPKPKPAQKPKTPTKNNNIKLNIED